MYVFLQKQKSEMTEYHATKIVNSEIVNSGNQAST